MIANPPERLTEERHIRRYGPPGRLTEDGHIRRYGFFILGTKI